MSKSRPFTCANCRVTISRDVQYEAWETMRQHTLEVHGREPHCNPVGQYRDDESQLRAEMNAFPERFFIMAA